MGYYNQWIRKIENKVLNVEPRNVKFPGIFRADLLLQLCSCILERNPPSSNLVNSALSWSSCEWEEIWEGLWSNSESVYDLPEDFIDYVYDLSVMLETNEF